MRLTITRAPEAGWLVMDQSGVPIAGHSDINEALIFMRSKLDPEAASAVAPESEVENVPPTGSGWPRLLRGGRS